MAYSLGCDARKMPSAHRSTKPPIVNKLRTARKQCRAAL
jgi:hypothetical protein